MGVETSFRKEKHERKRERSSFIIKGRWSSSRQLKGTLAAWASPWEAIFLATNHLKTILFTTHKPNFSLDFPLWAIPLISIQINWGSRPNDPYIIVGCPTTIYIKPKVFHHYFTFSYCSTSTLESSQISTYAFLK